MAAGIGLVLLLAGLHRLAPASSPVYAVSKDEFTAFVSGIAKVSGTDVDAQKLFAAYDADASGSLDDSEMQSLLASGSLPKLPAPPGKSKFVQR